MRFIYIYMYIIHYLATGFVAIGQLEKVQLQFRPQIA